MALSRRILHALLSAAAFVAAFVSVVWRIAGTEDALSVTALQFGVIAALWALPYYLVSFVRLITGGEPDHAGAWRLSVIGCLLVAAVAGCVLVLPHELDGSRVLVAAYVLADVVAPLLALLDWLSGEKGWLRMRHLTALAVVLAAYAAAVLALGPSRGWPYGFFDVSAHGLASVLGAMGVLGAVAMGLAVVIVHLDGLMGTGEDGS